MLDEVAPFDAEAFDRARDGLVRRRDRVVAEAASRELAEHPERRRFGTGAARHSDELAQQLEVEAKVQKQEARSRKRPRKR